MGERTIRRAMVLAAGLGTRLRPMTDHLPKPLAPVLDRPLLDHVLERLASAGVEHVVVNTHHLPDAIAAWAEARVEGPKVELRHEPEILGTAGGLANARDVLGADDAFLLHNGDVWCDADLGALAAAHPVDAAEATLLLADWPRVNSVRLGADGRVRDVADRLGAAPRPDDRRLTYTGVAVFSRRFLERLPEGRSELAAALLAAIADDPGAVRGMVQPAAAWSDLGTPSRYLEIHAELLATGDRVMRGEGATAAPGAVLRGFVVLGGGCRIDDGAEVEDCVVMPGAVVGPGERRRREVVGDGWSAPAAAPTANRPPADLADWLAAHGCGAPDSAEPLAGQASDRRFWRVPGADGPLILLDSSDDPGEFERTIAVSRFLSREGFGGPSVIAVDGKRRLALLEDLGDDTLARAVAAAPDERENLYDRALSRLADLQTRGSDLVRDGACPEAGDRVFGVDDLRTETRYFARRCLREELGLDPLRVDDLDGEFDALAAAVAAEPPVIMHRDFQCTNVMIREGDVGLVDVQGMRWGPPGYDAASLLRDPYADLPEEVVVGLRRRWIVAAAASGLGLDDPVRSFVLAGLQRNMQALGAYGYLARIRGKSAFRRWIPAGFRQLSCGLREWHESGQSPVFPRLEALLAHLKSRLWGVDST